MPLLCGGRQLFVWHFFVDEARELHASKRTFGSTVFVILSVPVLEMCAQTKDVHSSSAQARLLRLAAQPDMLPFIRTTVLVCVTR